MRQSNNKKSRDVTAFLYERLSRDDNLEGESYSIGNQKKLLTKVAKEKGYTNLVHFLDDGISGVTMDRPGFVEMIRQLEEGRAAAVFVKDLSRLGRNYCSNYKGNRGTCTSTHYVRVDFLEQVVLGEIKRLTKFASHYEDDFVKAVMGSTQESVELDRRLKQKELASLQARDEELDGLF